MTGFEVSAGVPSSSFGEKKNKIIMMMMMSGDMHVLDSDTHVMDVIKLEKSKLKIKQSNPRRKSGGGQERKYEIKQKFPEKLWDMVNGCQTGAIGWAGHLATDDETPIQIVVSQFKKEFLKRDEEQEDKPTGVTKREPKRFKTQNMPSFIRQLNLYGFRKVVDRSHDTATLHYYKNSNFRKGRKDLLAHIFRSYTTKPEGETSSPGAKKMRRTTKKRGVDRQEEDHREIVEDEHLFDSEAERAVMMSILAEEMDQQLKDGYDENQDHNYYSPPVEDGVAQELQVTTAPEDEINFQKEVMKKDWMERVIHQLDSRRYGLMSFGDQEGSGLRSPGTTCRDLMDSSLKPSSVIHESPLISVLPLFTCNPATVVSQVLKVPSEFLSTPPESAEQYLHL